MSLVVHQCPLCQNWQVDYDSEELVQHVLPGAQARARDWPEYISDLAGEVVKAVNNMIDGVLREHINQCMEEMVDL